MKHKKNIKSDQINEVLEAGPGSSGANDLKLHQVFATTRMSDEGDDDKGLGRAMITTESVDREADIVVASGAQMSNFRNNPIVLFGHNYWEASAVVGRSVQEVIHPNNGIEGAWLWADDVSEDAAKVRGLWDGGFLNAISIGFMPLEWEKRTDHTGEDLPGWKFTSWELLEYSVVIVPANQDALRLSLDWLTGKMEGQAPGDQQGADQGKRSAALGLITQGLNILGIETPKDLGDLISSTGDKDTDDDNEPNPTDDDIEPLKHLDPQAAKQLADLMAAFKQSLTN